ncbi:hypothetical protein B0T24DRAFT_301179 [Lasiosphaeria ovina]|uniref:Uncharacterized protein n=1 Tax=Lasiosphaeria ovina TaxID=92902 RepID=A0AAE0K7L0_9PEZI|nr:hypothetical protein B0T24DRAFT_301179 [Lasiosphaeria ovina]
MFPTLVRRLAQAPKPQIFESITAPSKPKRVWPPDFTKMTPQEQLRFEKRYKRRLAHMAQRPRWNKIVKLTQYFTISFVLVYSVLFMDAKNEHQPFEGLRAKFWGALGVFSPDQRHERREDAPVEQTTTK